MWLINHAAPTLGCSDLGPKPWTTAQLSHVPSQKLHNRTVLGFAAESGKTSSPSRAEKCQMPSSSRCRFASGKRNLQRRPTENFIIRLLLLIMQCCLLSRCNED
jgi:hypothetical protein